LRAIARLGPADWAEDGIDADLVDQLRALFDDWRRQLAAVSE
jgi:hypothetical protein